MKREDSIKEFGLIMTPKLKTIVFSICGNFDEIEDIIQKTYIAILNAILKTISDHNLYGWIYRIVRYKVIDRYWEKKAFGQPVDIDVVKAVVKTDNIEDAILIYSLCFRM